MHIETFSDFGRQFGVMKKVLDTVEHLCICLQLLVMVASQGTLTIYAKARRPLRAILHNGTDGDL